MIVDYRILIQSKIVIVIYVDDLRLVWLQYNDLNMVKKELLKSFKISNFDICTFHLGISVTKDHESQVLSLGKVIYIKKIFQNIGIHGCEPFSTSIEANNQLRNAKFKYKKRRFISVRLVVVRHSYFYICVANGLAIRSSDQTASNNFNVII